MSQNIAILIGNTQYQNLSNLECCANDVARMHELLAHTQKFNQILDYVDKPLHSVKDALRHLSALEGGYEEVFFYFTGHGLSNSDDFYMCFDGFREASPNSTGLSRTDAYDIVKAFSAELSVFVIDACEAGRNLIKSDPRPLTREPKSGFSKFMQISSCTETQFSLAGKDISVFTDQFIKACLKTEQGIIYYSDIENALRDAFLNDAAQTPHFIRQGTLVEQFCPDASRLDPLRLAILEQDSEVEQAVENTASNFEIAKSRIESIESKVPTKESAQAFINGVFEQAIGQAELTPEVAEFFNVRTIKHNNFDNVQNKKTVVGLLQRRGGSDSFVESDVQTMNSSDPFGGFGLNALAALRPPSQYDKTYNLFNRCGLESLHVGIYFQPKFMALNRIFSEIVFLPRLTECLILTCNSIQLRSGWGSFNEYTATKQWKWSHHAWSEDLAKVAKAYVSDPYQFAVEYIHSFAES